MSELQSENEMQADDPFGSEQNEINSTFNSSTGKSETSIFTSSAGKSDNFILSALLVIWVMEVKKLPGRKKLDVHGGWNVPKGRKNVWKVWIARVRRENMSVGMSLLSVRKLPEMKL